MDDGQIVLSTNVPKKNNKFLWIALAVILVIGLGAGIVALVNMAGQSLDGGKTDEDVLVLTEDSYVEMSSIQSTLIKGKWGNLSALNFFSEQTKENINNNLVGVVQEFYTTLEQYNENNITDEYARENLITLKEAIKKDLPLYTKLVEIYNLFYDYVNSDYDAAYAEKIMDLDEPSVLTALQNLDDTVETYGSYEGGTIIYDIFNAALGEDYPEVQYYELIGKIIAGLKDEE